MTREAELIGKLRLIAKDCHWQLLEDAADTIDKLRYAERQRDDLLADIERCYRMLLSEPDTKGALFKAENILRESIASVKGGAAND